MTPYSPLVEGTAAPVLLEFYPKTTPRGLVMGGDSKTENCMSPKTTPKSYQDNDGLAQTEFIAYKTMVSKS